MLFSQNPKEMTEQQRNSILILRSKVPCFDKVRRTLEGPYSRYQNAGVEFPCFSSGSLDMSKVITMDYDIFQLTRLLTAPGLFARTSFTVWKTSTVCSILTRSITEIMVATQPLRPIPSL